MSKQINWTVYVLRCADNSLYTGITTDVGRRVYEHNNSGRLAARYTRGRRPLVLVYVESTNSRSIAMRREKTIKMMSRQRKLRLIAGG